MASPTRWTWVWASSGSWWWAAGDGVLQSMGSQRVGHDWATELNWGTQRSNTQKCKANVNRRKGRKRQQHSKRGDVKPHVHQWLDYPDRKPVRKLRLWPTHEAVDTRRKFHPEATQSTSSPAHTGIPQGQSHIRPENKANLRRLRSHQASFLTTVAWD